MDLPPRVFDTLVALVAERGNLVEKDRLMQTVWPDAVVEENNLSQAISLLRKVLRDGEDGFRYIETVPKRGYRFVAPVREVEVENPEDEAGGSPSKPVSATAQRAPSSSGGASAFAGRARRFRGMLAVFGVAVLVLAGIWFAIWRARLRNQAGLVAIRSIAVLPLQNFSADAEQEYFADGMTDELITDLAQVHELRVVSRTSVMQYKGTHQLLPQIGRDLGVDAVIEGSVVRSGNRVRITAQLIRTDSDSHLWAKSYEGDMKDILSLQASVAEAITNEVKLNLSSAERNRLQRPAVNPEAYEAYLRGRFFWNRRDDAGFKKAVEYFNQAIAKDPDFALAYAGLADCYILMVLDSPDPEKMAQAKAAALKALAIDDHLAEAHTSLAAVKIFLDWDWVGAESEFKRAIDLSPNYAPAHHWYGNILLGPLGRHEEAIAELKRAQSLDPLSLIISTDVGYASYLARRYDEAFAQYQKVLAMDPSFLPVHSDLAQYYLHAGREDQWFREVLVRSDPEFSRILRDLYTKGGFHKVTLEGAVTQGTYHVAGMRPSFFAAAASYAHLGRRQEALGALEKAYQVHEPGLIYLNVDPLWDRFRTEAAFQSIEHRMGLPSAQG